MEQSSWFWRDGQVLAWEAHGSVSLLAHTLHYGVGAFEGLRAYERADGRTYVFRLKEHIDRLFDSCRLVLIEPRVSRDDCMAGCKAVLQKNGMRDGYIRPIVLLGLGKMGLLPEGNPVETSIMAWNWGTYLGADGLEKGIRAKISSFARHHVNIAFCRGKLVGQYINSVVAKREAKLAGYDEALLLDVNGYVVEGSGENLFVVKSGVVYTPPLSSSILPGITRDTVIALAIEHGLTVREERLTRDAVYLADEVFLTGTAAEVTPVREVDDRTIGAGAVGEVTRQLQDRYFDIVRGSDDSHPEWLAAV